MFNVLAWPRVSWKLRLLVAIGAAFFILQVVQQWPHRHDALALARWYAWVNLASAVWLGVLCLPVVITGRMPKSFAVIFRRPGRLRMTLPQIHADIAREQQQERERTRPL